jgi:HEAT repeat protein
MMRPIRPAVPALGHGPVPEKPGPAESALSIAYPVAMDDTTAAWLEADPREFTYDVAALRAMAGDERARAVEQLVARVAAGDVRAIETAIAVPLPELEASIRALGPSASGPAREAAARALARFGDRDAVVELVSRLERGHPMVRINAAYELARSDDRLATEGLLRALTDTESIVRVHAWEGLVRRLGLEALATVRHSPLGTLFVLVCSDVPASVARGAERFTSIARRIGEGETPAQLGLDVPLPEDDVAVDSFVASMRDDERPIDVEAVRAMDPLHREWAIAIVVAAAGRGDPRVGAALAALDVAWAIDAVRALPDR